MVNLMGCNKLKSLISKAIKSCYQGAVYFYHKIGVHLVLGIIFFSCGISFADDDNPFPSIDVSDGNIVKASGTYIQLALKYGTLGVGGLLVLISLGVLILRMRDDSRDKEHGNLIMTFVFITLGCTIGFVLIAIGWKAFNAQIQT